MYLTTFFIISKIIKFQIFLPSFFILIVVCHGILSLFKLVFYDIKEYYCIIQIVFFKSLYLDLQHGYKCTKICCLILS